MPTDALHELLAPARLTEVVDVGASPIDGEPPYVHLLRRGLCRVTGFEAQPDALALLEQAKGPKERYLPYAIGDGGEGTLRVCAAPGMTSLLEPDPTMLALFEEFPAWGEVRARIALRTRQLDHVTEVERLDFLKIDVQGSELAVFRGGRAKLARAVAIQTEVSFVPLYEKQPALGEIDHELRGQGFIPHCFAAVKFWPLQPWQSSGGEHRPPNQLLEADMVYVRDFSRVERLDDEQLKHLALIVHHCYDSFDLALRCLRALEARGALRAGSTQRYLESPGRA